MATDPTTASMDAAAAAFAHLRDVPAETQVPGPFGVSDPTELMREVDRMRKESEQPMLPVLERMLTEADANLAEGQIVAFEGQVWFKDKTAIKGAIRRSVEPGVYVVGLAASDQSGRPLPDQLVEIYFHAGDATRVAVLRKIEMPKIVMVGGSNGKLIIPNS